MAVYEADLIASQILKEFVISKWNKTNNECSILRRFSDFNLKEVLKIQEWNSPGIQKSEPVNFSII